MLSIYELKFWSVCQPSDLELILIYFFLQLFNTDLILIYFLVTYIFLFLGLYLLLLKQIRVTSNTK